MARQCTESADCRGGELCRDGMCVPIGCEPACGGKECGFDGCGGSCGPCGVGESCSGAGQCVAGCTPDCAGKDCGDDGCGGGCGLCAAGLSCTGAGQCVGEAGCATDADCASGNCVAGSCGPRLTCSPDQSASVGLACPAGGCPGYTSCEGQSILGGGMCFEPCSEDPAGNYPGCCGTGFVCGEVLLDLFGGVASRVCCDPAASYPDPVFGFPSFCAAPTVGRHVCNTAVDCAAYVGCVQCVSGSDCGGQTPICSGSNTCVPCTQNADCSNGRHCAAGSCVL